MKECPACNRCFPDNVNHCPSDGDALRASITGDTVLDSRYQLEKRLGQGGMGVVFKGRHVYLKTSHAIKIILPDLVGNDPSLVTRFRQEAMAAANIRHQNIINVTDFGVVNNTMPFLVMELCEGRSLHDILAEEKRLPPARAIEIMLAVAAGVGAAHNQGIVHRDLKPLNIMLKDDCSAAEGVKVLDFGLAKIKSGDLLGSFVAAQTQGLMGSPFYMAPEQWSDEEPDARADIYALGVILYQMLAGEVPFRGNSIPSIMKKHLGEPPPPFAAKGIDVPPEVERVVRHALEKEPEKRPQAVVELSLELLQALSAVSAPAAPSAVGPAAAGADFGMKTEVSSGQGTAPPAPVRAGGQATGELAARGGAASVDVAGREAGPPDFEESAPAAPARVETSPRIEHAEGRETSHDIAAGATALIPDAAVEGDDSLSPAPPSQPLPSAQPPTPQSPSTRPSPQSSSLPTPSDASTTPLQTPSTSLPPAPPAAVPEGSSPGFTESPSFYAAPPVVSSETQAFATMTPGVEHLSQFQDSSQVTVEPAAQERAGSPPPPVFAPPPAAPTAATPRAGASSAAAPAGSRVPMTVWAAGGVLALLFVVAGLYFALKPTQTDDEANRIVRPNANATPEANRAGGGNANVAAMSLPGPTPDLVSLPGGSFMMGRNDVPPRTSAVALTYQAWMYNQWPAHSVNVQPFAIDRTEVTNAEYAEFVEKTNHAPPAEWGGRRPPAGQEKWPVGGVSLDDAERFARWRSERDGVQYRLPTEAEWEYAARGGSANLYPWGAEWVDGRANLETDALSPVGSFPEGATPQGALDMIGNVWEWTSTQAGMYRGNTELQLRQGDRGKFVVRGGSYQSKSRGDEPITATSRRWVPRDERNAVVGFRLVRPEK